MSDNEENRQADRPWGESVESSDNVTAGPEFLSDPVDESTVTVDPLLDPDGLAPTKVVESGQDPLIGAVMGNYRIQRQLGKGGFGQVYQAWDEALGRKVAIKFLLETVDDEWRQWFEREAKAVAALSKHPNIVDIYHWGQHQGRSYFSMDFVESGAAQLLKLHPEGLPVAKALQVALDCAQALEAAHAQNILHRDIKPLNILIEPESGQAKVTDFGLARYREVGAVTLGDRISGSPSYMSPEQAEGEELDARSDLFSLGVTLYQLLSNKLPFEAETATAVLKKIKRNDSIPLRQRRPDLPEKIFQLVEKAMAHRPDDRFQTAREFAEEIRIILQTIERSGRIEEPRRGVLARGHRGVRPVFALGAVAVVVIGLVIWGAFSRQGGSAGLLFSQAEAAMNQGSYAAAAASYSEYLVARPADDRALYGLAMAQLQDGDTPRAEDTARRVKDPSLRAESELAVAYAQGAEPSEQALSRLEEAPTPYGRVLLAKLDAINNHFDAVLQRLDGLNGEGFHYLWQYAEAQQMLAQAYYHAKRFDEAARLFQQLQTDAAGNGNTSAVAEAYLALISREQNRERREEVRAAAQRLKEAIAEGGQVKTDEELWTSRPLTFFVLPASVDGSRIAVNQGLADLFPTLLGHRLDEQPSMNLVNRELINEILAEQELSALVSSRSGQLALGRLLGARLILTSAFVRAGGKERLVITANDVETSEEVPIQSLDLSAHVDLDALVARAADTVEDVVASVYPLQARLYLQDGRPCLNIGSETGLAGEMTFDIFRHPDLPPIPDVSVVVSGTPGSRSTWVTLEGVRAEQLPDSEEKGWYVRERETS